MHHEDVFFCQSIGQYVYGKQRLVTEISEGFLANPYLHKLRKTIPSPSSTSPPFLSIFFFLHFTSNLHFVLKPVAEDEFLVVQRFESFLDNVEDIWGKIENAVYRHFLSPKCFKNPILLNVCSIQSKLLLNKQKSYPVNK